MIRSVRQVIQVLLKKQRLDDEGLATVMCQAENIVNSRPLTHVSEDAQDPLNSRHQITCCILMRHHCFRQESLMRRIFTVVVAGDKSRICQKFFGTDGASNTLHRCSVITSSSTRAATSNRMTSCYCLTTTWQGVSGPWVACWKCAGVQTA